MAGFVAVPARYNPAAPAVPYGHGAEGPRYPVYGAVSHDNPPPAPLLQDELQSATLHYSRPSYPNTYGAQHSSSVTTYDPEASTIRPTPARVVPSPVSRKRYDQATIRRTFGQWAQDFPNDGRGMPRPAIQQRGVLYRALRGRRRQMEGAYFPRMTESPPSGTSWGQYTETIPVQSHPMTESVF